MSTVTEIEEAIARLDGEEEAQDVAEFLHEPAGGGPAEVAFLFQREDETGWNLGPHDLIAGGKKRFHTRRERQQASCREAQNTAFMGYRRDLLCG